MELVSAHLVPLFTALFSLMSKPDYPENDYLMRTLMRVVAFVQSGVTPYAGQVIEGLTTILTRVCANPANPTFNHYLFETVAALMKNVCAARPESVADFEAMLFPPFQVCDVTVTHKHAHRRTRIHTHRIHRVHALAVVDASMRLVSCWRA